MENTQRPAPNRPSTRDRIAATDPLILMAGAAIAGVAAGSLLPRSDAETRLLGPIGSRVNRAAGTLAVATRRIVTEEVGAVPVIGQVAVEQIDRVLDAVVEPA